MKIMRLGAVGIAFVVLTLGASGVPARALARPRAYLSVTSSSSTAKIYAKIMLTGRLTNRVHHVLANRPIRLESRPATGTVWSVASTKTTKSTGKVYWPVQPKDSTYYRLRYVGSSKYRPAHSPDKKVTGHHYGLAFEDAFSGSTVSTATWIPSMLWGDTASNFLQHYRPDALETTSGSLIITASHPRPSVDTMYPYNSGAITSCGSPGYSFRYGYIKTRAQIPKGQGLWSAVWILSTDPTSGDEIDVLEARGQYPKTNVMSLHYKTFTKTGTVRHAQSGKHYPNDENKSEYAASKADDLSRAYHTFAVDWSPTRVIWYRDGVERFRVKKTAQISREAMYITANLQLAKGKTSWAGEPNARTPFPSKLKVDYIRVYKHN